TAMTDKKCPLPASAAVLAGVLLWIGALGAGDAEQTQQVDDSNSHTYRSPRAERRYDNRQETVEQKKLNNDTARLNAAAAQANEQAKKDELKTKLAESEQKRKDETDARKDTAQARREAIQEKKEAANLTPDKLPDAVAAEQKELAGLDPVPEGVAGEAVKMLRTKALAITLENESVALWQLCARDGDIAKVPPGSYNAAALVNKGLLSLVLPLDPDKAPAVPDTIQAKAKAATALESLDQDLLGARIKETHAQKKLFVAGPAASLIAAWGDAKCAAIVKEADVVILPVEKWAAEDKTALKTDFVATVLKYTAAIRLANPKARIFLQVGAKPDAGTSSGTAQDWLATIQPIVAKDAACFDGLALVAVKTKLTDDPKLGLGAVKQMFAWLRPPPAAPTTTTAGNKPGQEGGNAPEISATPAPGGISTRDSVDGTVGK
ncbi:MAG TPA: hypothetical protein VL860_11370, partial [Planctomycetota bacterium]|nr:hypothetical protein [Planctomycetota bacterium]